MSKIYYPSRKRFGQNFLTDSIIIEKIINILEPIKQAHFFEIGPGHGALTIPLLERCKHLDAIELDRDLLSGLRVKAFLVGELNLIAGDILKFFFSQHFLPGKKFRCVGNLPYNISTPVIFHLLKQKQWIEDMHFMLQKEVADRITAVPRTTMYGRLSVMVQYYCEVEQCFLVPPECFYPRPKVTSTMIKLKPRSFISYPVKNEGKFEQIVKIAFNQRRKILSNSLKKIVPIEIFSNVGIDPNLRAEELSVEHFVKLTNAISTH